MIAALNDVAVGGRIQIALISDQRLAHLGIKMGQPEINAGIPLHYGVLLEKPAALLVKKFTVSP